MRWEASFSLFYKHGHFCIGRIWWVLSLNSTCMVDRIIPPKDAHILISETCEYVTFHSKRDFADVIKLKSWDREIIKWAQRNPKSLYKKGTKGPKLEREGNEQCKQRSERKREMWKCYATNFQDEGKGHEPKNAGASRSWKSQGDRFSPWVSQRNTALPTPWV